MFPPRIGTCIFPYLRKFPFHLTNVFQEEAHSSYSSLPPLDYLNLIDFTVLKRETVLSPSPLRYGYHYVETLLLF